MFPAQAVLRCNRSLDELSHCRDLYPELVTRENLIKQARIDALEQQALQRATYGTPTPVFDKRGNQTGEITKYSDHLSSFMLKGLRPEVYNPDQKLSLHTNQPFTVVVRDLVNEAKTNA